MVRFAGEDQSWENKRIMLESGVLNILDPVNVRKLVSKQEILFVRN
jgi:hypothetical protein